MNTIKVDNEFITPSKIVAVGRNYVDHVKELNNDIPDEMVVFLKPNSAISDRLLASHQGEALHYEGEIALLVQGGGFAAVGFGLDLTKRALQSRLKTKGLPWERAKAFDGAAVFSDFVSFTGDMSQLSLKLSINNTPTQAGGVQQMMFKPERIWREVNTFVTLEDGDIVMTGTPKGVGEIHAGDQFDGGVYAGEQLLVSKSWRAEA